MSAEFNDYIRLTRGYLKDYNRMRTCIRTWEKEKKEIEYELSSLPMAVSRYGGELGGGSGELSVVERLAQTRIKLTNRLFQIEHDVKELHRVMKKIENAVAALDPETRDIVWSHYVEGKKWYDVADVHYLSYSCASQKGYRAIRVVACMIFGQKAACPERTLLLA